MNDDTIELDNNVFADLKEGFLELDAFYAGSAAHDNSDRIIYDPMTGAVYYDADGTFNTAVAQFATMPKRKPTCRGRVRANFRRSRQKDLKIQTFHSSGSIISRSSYGIPFGSGSELLPATLVIL